MSVTSYEQSPYYDDFAANNVEAKNYLRILFRPGLSVQNRELNQLQTMLQSQIAKFGESVYVDGTPVNGGKTSFDRNIRYFDVDVSESANVNLVGYISQLTRVQNADGILADVLSVKRLATASDVFKYRIYVRYASSVQDGSNLNVAEFLVTDEITNSVTVEDGDSNVMIGTGSPIGEVEAVGFASMFLVQKGVFFTRGCFVVTDEQKLFVDLASETELLSGYAAFRVTEDTKSYIDDTTLLDNASGTPNYNAPGANRYVITLSLEFVSDDAVVENSTNLIRLLQVGNSATITPARTEYSNLDRVLAQRTSEESGNYTVRPFGIDVRGLYNDGAGNRGKFTEDQLVDLGYTVEEAGAKYVVGIEPSVAYVQGYRIELVNRRDLIVDRARDTAYTEAAYSSARLGNYIEGQIVLDTGTDQLANITRADYVYSIFEADGTTLVGTCSARGLEYVSGSTYRFFISNVSLEAGKVLSDGEKLRGNNFSFDNASGFVLFESGLNRSLFPFPNSTVKSLYETGSPTPEIRYKVRKHFTATSATPGLTQVGATYTWVVSAGTNYKFVDDSPSAYIIMESDYGVIVPTNVVIAPGGATATLTFTGANPIGTKTLTLHAGVEALNIAQKTKTISAQTYGGVAYAPNIELPHGDIYRILSIKVAGGPDVDIKDQFVLDNGQRDHAYTNGVVKYIGTIDRSAQSFNIVYEYFAHSGSGDYFSVDSYSLVYDLIPSYAGTRLSDVLDFRPLLLSGGGSITQLPIDPNSVFVAGLEYYIPRIDKVVLSDSGEFKVISGISALNPVAPSVPGNTMTLYVLNVPAYTFSAKDIGVKYIDNRRYTMRDIGDLANRVKNLEYYTTLSLLEKEASGKQILDDAGGDRYKNGILVDSFLGHSIGDTSNKAYKCSVDTQNGILRPTYTTENIQFIFDEVDTGCSINQNTITLAFTELPLIEQPFASITESVNPYDVAAWIGTVILSPASDEWKSTTVAPDVVINERGAYDAIANLVDRTNVLGTQWNEWEVSWKGRSTEVLAPSLVKVSNTTTQIREGVRTTLSYTDVEQTIGSNVVDMSFIPFIRSRTVYFAASLLKPNTRVYPFFDEVDISDYTKSAAFVAWKDVNAVTLYEGVAADDLPFSPDALITDETGKVSGYFVIPNNSALRFRTGERQFKLTDSPTNDNVEATTTASFVYSASGLLETKQNTILSTRTPQLTTSVVTESKNSVKITYWDPLAQSFVIGDIDTGAFITSVDLYFAKKSSKDIPVILQVVTVENGVPTQKVVPFSTVVIDASAVNVSDDASEATTFTFSDPVYLQSGAEYALVVRSNDSDYRLWISEVGGRDVTTDRLISKNPYAGVMFTSQNASTWTPEQNRDLKFTINRAVFEGDGSTTFEKLLNDDVLPISFSSFNLTAQDVVLPDTSVAYTLNTLGSSSSVTPGWTYNKTAESTLVDDTGILRLYADLSSGNNYISPVIDLDRLSLLTIKNVVNDSVVNESTRDAGSAQARYLTKRVDLNDPAEQIDVYLLANRPSDNTNVNLYVKLKFDDSVPFEDLPWTLVNPISPLPVSSDGAYTEVQYELSSEGTPFTAFQTKIVLRSTQPAEVPSVKDFRLIATT